MRYLTIGDLVEDLKTGDIYTISGVGGSPGERGIEFKLEKKDGNSIYRIESQLKLIKRGAPDG